MMKKMLSLLIVIFTLQLFGEEGFTMSEKGVLQEMSVVVSLKNLVINPNGISIVYGERSFLVNSIERKGEHWIATIAFGRDAGYCPRGHDLCTRCGLCHLEGCWYYVEPCWRK